MIWDPDRDEPFPPDPDPSPARIVLGCLAVLLGAATLVAVAVTLGMQVIR